MDKDSLACIQHNEYVAAAGNSCHYTTDPIAGRVFWERSSTLQNKRRLGEI